MSCKQHAKRRVHLRTGRDSSLNRAAFSLVELIVVMVILGMLAGLVAVRTRGYLISSKQNAAKAEIANIVKAIETFLCRPRTLSNDR